MSIHVALHHVTTYAYSTPIQLGPQTIRLRPAPYSRTPVLSYALKVAPETHFINWQQDPQGNYLARLVFPEKTDTLRVEVDLTADMTVINPFDFFLEESAEVCPFRYEPWLKKELRPYLQPANDPEEDRVEAYVAELDKTKCPTIDFLVGLNQRLQGEIRYLIRMEPGTQAPGETLKHGSGSCRDFAWLLVNVLRRLGLAARFVSGYLIQLKADTESLDGPTGPDADFTDLHAWTEVYLPGAGWVGMDATSGLLTGEGHIPLVAAPEPASAAPITGSVESCETTFGHEMKVTRFRETPRVTYPYTDEQWREIRALGREVDRRLDEGKVNLTMGGEPTFVSIDDMEGAEWNTQAFGDHKRRLAQTLLQRLTKRWTSGPLIYRGMGKWYPGEPLPRWVLGCYWRSDGEPMWRDPTLLADETQAQHHSTEEAGDFIKALAERLVLPPDHVVPGYEDVLYYLWKEERLPENVDPLDAKLDDPLERKRLAHLFDGRLGDIVGFALPLRGKLDGDCVTWISSPWHFRAGQMFLVPGDSPMGLRMPLDALPWLPPEKRDVPVQPDPMAERESRPFMDRNRRESGGVVPAQVHQDRDAPASVADEAVRTAICVQVREGRIHVFLPPVDHIELYLDLIRGIETTAAALQLPVVVEGYAPPFDPRIQSFKITPDPGVIEVNVAPVANWEELVQQTTSLYEEARLSRLGTEKFMLDGRHSGTGGGNHVVLGGPTPAQSPFLKRPDLLGSMVSYWHNHPALSYLFSGLFIGPTSQSPRVDEGRRDSLYELEIALRQLWKESDRDDACPPWLVDRLFRHLLVDGTGNTHRAEFCIDKLYFPDSTTGRLGLVELRGFEMPPHAQMSLVQQLLIRGLVAFFWHEPYRRSLVRWDTSLHDRFLLPHYVQADLQDVLEDLSHFGIALRPDHFASHVEFRFPFIGEIQCKGMHLELRSAIEPWYVLGEETSQGGTSRFVDSSVERLQVKVRGRVGERYLVCCNGHPLPLQHTGVEGEFVAGVRYRAWQPPSCLHPTIKVHTPLTFDLVDTWSRHSLGGCTYHVSHPGGRNYETFPVNAFEAQARRAARFFKIGHSTDVMASKPMPANPDYPCTLDLRRC